MKKYYCTLCGYRYISAFGSDEKNEPVRGLPPHPAGKRLVDPPADRSDFGMLSEAWRCPHCGALKRFFRPESDRSARGL